MTDRFLNVAVAFVLTLAAVSGGVADDSTSASEILLQAELAAQDIEDAYDRALTLRDIASSLSRSGAHDSAATTFIRAVRCSGTIENAARKGIALRSIAMSQIDLQYIDSALQTLRHVDDEYLRLPVLKQVWEHLVRSGESDVALDQARQLKVLSYRAASICFIAGRQAEMGNFDLALKTVGSIDDGHGYIKDEARSVIAIELYRKQQFMRADDELHQVSEPYWRFDAYLNAASILAVANKSKAQSLAAKAARIAYAERDQYDLELNYLPKLVESFFDVGDFKMAGEAAARAEEDNQAAFLSTIAFAKLKVGDAEGARRTAHQIKPGENGIDTLFYKDPALKAVVSSHAEREAVERAELVLAEIEDHRVRAESLALIAVAYARHGERPDATEMFRRALELVPVTDAPQLDVTTLIEISQAQLQSGASTQARVTLRDAHQRALAITSINHHAGPVRPLVLQDVAIAQATAGAFAASLATSRDIDNGKRSETVRRIASIQAESGRTDEALSWAGKQALPIDKARALLGAAEGLLHTRIKP